MLVRVVSFPKQDISIAWGRKGGGIGRSRVAAAGRAAEALLAVKLVAGSVAQGQADCEPAGEGAW